MNGFGSAASGLLSRTPFVAACEESHRRAFAFDDWAECSFSYTLKFGASASTHRRCAATALTTSMDSSHSSGSQE